MKHRKQISSVLTAALLLVACSYNAPPVPIAGRAGDVALLAGQWQGQYRFDNAVRHGSIIFRLSAGQDTAYGDVLMIADYMNSKPFERAPDGTISGAQRPTSGALSIAFVHSSNGVVEGSLEPYRDPSCRCRLRTVFTGRLDGDVVRGTFTSTNLDTDVRSTGTWEVKRLVDNRTRRTEKERYL